jgi:hypothetical protein
MNVLVSRIEEELNNSTLTEYKCLNGTIIKTDVGYVEDWFNEWRNSLPKSSPIKTGLTDAEKESLLKLFLISGELRYSREAVLDGKYQFNVFENSQLKYLSEEHAKLILKAMDNLRNSALGF